MSASGSPIIGIDLGTTNSVVAAYIQGSVQVLEEEGESLLPSIVGMTLDNQLAVGRTARNQLAAFPERTIASIKRRMGQAVQLDMAGQEFSPQEISAIILRRLRQRAEQALGQEVTRAVITVPAFFDENQRQATREAGRLAGFTVERIINEPTAASLVYHAGSPDRRHLIVYDLGGGTFDVSIVRVEGGVVEVLSSKGDTQLGGDDFDQLLTKHVASEFLARHNCDLMAESTSRWRLLQACERAKCELSSTATVRVSEEFIATVDGQPVNLDVALTRATYESLISPLVERTIACVDDAIRDSGLSTFHLDELLLVGGSTRTPLVQQRLHAEFHLEPKWAVNPDFAVALGAATQAAMQDGHPVGPVLIDVATHTLGIEVLDRSQFSPRLRAFPIIRRNSPLPAKYEEVFRTVTLDQETADIRVLQGESDEASHNQSVGRFLLEGLNESEDADGTILVRFELTLDGVLKVTATEHPTGITNTLKIENALSQMGVDAGVSEARLSALFSSADTLPQLVAGAKGELSGKAGAGRPDSHLDSQSDLQSDQAFTALDALIATARSVRSSLGQADLEDLDRILASIEQARAKGDDDQLDDLQADLDDLLFYLKE